MSSWLSNRLGIHWNLRPLAAPAGALVGGIFGGAPGAALGAGVAKTADNKLHGDSWGHSLEQGALNAGIYGLGAEFLPKIGGGGGGADGEAATPGYSAAPGGGWTAVGGQNPVSAGVVGPGSAAGATAAASAPGQSLSSQLLSPLRSVGSAIKDNPLAVGQTASGILNAREGSQQLDFQKQQYTDEQDRRKRIADLLGPIYQQMMASRTPVAPNPYAPR